MKNYIDYIDLFRHQHDSYTRHLSERDKRLLFGSHVQLLIGLGYEGEPIRAMAEATGASYNTVAKGLRELEEGGVPNESWQRKPGGGRKKISETHPEVMEALIEEIEPVTRGDPESQNKWASKSTRKIALNLAVKGSITSYTLVATLMRSLDYSLQTNSKVIEVKQHPDRNKQLKFIKNMMTLCKKLGTKCSCRD
jgi:transposase